MGKARLTFCLISLLLWFVCTTYFFLTRFWLWAYFISGQSALMTALVSIYTGIHAVIPADTWHYLSLTPANARHIQCIMTIFLFVVITSSTTGYVVLNLYTVHVNKDFVAAASFGVVSSLLLLVLMFMKVCVQRAATESDDEEHQCQDEEIELTSNDNQGHIKPKYVYESPEPWPLYMKISSWTIYVITHFAFIIGVVLSVLYSISTTLTLLNYRPGTLVKTSVIGHGELSLDVRCYGRVNDPVVMYEPTLGYTMGHSRPFIVNALIESGFRVCTHNRRGYGFSETVEHDRIENVTSPQSALSSCEYLRQASDLVNMTSHPSVYIGYEYGAYISLLTALYYPSSVRAIVLIKPLPFTNTAHPWDIRMPAWREFLTPMLNYNASSQIWPTGLVHFGLETGLTDLYATYPYLNGTSAEDLEEIVNELKVGYNYVTYLREWYQLDRDYLDVAGKLNETLVKHPTLIVTDKDDRAKVTKWLPKNSFTEYKESVHLKDIEVVGGVDPLIHSNVAETVTEIAQFINQLPT